MAVARKMVGLDPATHELLKILSEEKGRPATDIVRDALAIYMTADTLIAAAGRAV